MSGKSHTPELNLKINKLYEESTLGPGNTLNIWEGDPYFTDDDYDYILRVYANFENRSTMLVLRRVVDDLESVNSFRIPWIVLDAPTADVSGEFGVSLRMLEHEQRRFLKEVSF